MGDINQRIDDLLGGVTSAYTVFTLSEIFFGVFPPEVFMIWALGGGTLSYYAQHVLYLSIVSYISGGIIGYLIGYRLNKTILFRFYKRRFLRKFEDKFIEYGGFLVVIAALTPIPFAAICMLAGAYRLDFKKFLLFSSTRFLRFWVYAIIIWNTKGL